MSIRHSNQSDEGKNLTVHNYAVRTAISLQLVFAQKAFVVGSCLDKVWIRHFSNQDNKLVFLVFGLLNIKKTCSKVAVFHGQCA